MEKIVFDPNWIPLVEIIEEAPAVPGIYMLVFDKPIKYDKAVRRIIYIGSSINLRKRLQQHNMDPNIYLFQNIQDQKENLYAFFYPFFEVRDQKEILKIEQDAFSSFINKFGVYPICNWMPPTKYLGTYSTNENIKYEYFKIHIFHVEDQSNIKPLTYDEIAKKYDLDYDQSYDRVQFRPKGFFAEVKERKHDRYIKSLSNIFWYNIACWDLDKYKEIIKIIKKLAEDKTKKLKTHRFQALFSKVPRPHTWGEVAVVLARVLAGSWHPAQKLSVEIYCYKTLLGRGRVSESGGRGWDVSDLPQRSTRRPYWLRQFEIINQKAEREAWRLHEEGKLPAPNAIGRIVEEGDWLSFRLYDWVIKEREQEYRERPEKLFRQAFDS